MEDIYYSLHDGLSMRCSKQNHTKQATKKFGWKRSCKTCMFSGSHTLFIKRSVRFHTVLPLDEIKYMFTFLDYPSPCKTSLKCWRQRHLVYFFLQNNLQPRHQVLSVFLSLFNMAAVMSLRYPASVNRCNE